MLTKLSNPIILKHSFKMFLPQRSIELTSGSRYIHIDVSKIKRELIGIYNKYAKIRLFHKD